MKDKYIGLIMAGGQGTRFWPWSTEQTPKQFLEIVGTRSLISQTFSRLSEFINPRNIFVIADRKYMDQTLSAIPELSRENFIAEPAPRNTAPCLIYANIVLSQKGDDRNVLVVPADHHIPETGIFAKQMTAALEYADSRCIITSGIRPRNPHTGYGYICFNMKDPAVQDGVEFYDVSEFREKPDLDTAKRYLAQGNYFWNSGMFIYKLKYFRELLKAYAPYYHDQYEILRKSELGSPESDEIFKGIRRDSIDFALMEKVKEMKLFRADFSWNDVGSWSSVYEMGEKDADGNVSRGNGFFLDSRQSLVFTTQEKPVVVMGLDDVVVVNTDNGLLITRSDQVQNIKAATRLVNSGKKD